VARRNIAEVRSTIDTELRAVLARVRPSPAELVLLWPRLNHRGRVPAGVVLLRYERVDT
jgi:hypothetical protein